MCTAASYTTRDFYFGRTLDYEFSYGEEIIITPRNYPLHFRHMPAHPNHYAMIGIAHVMDTYPLYYEAVNEAGLAIAGLNFVGNAHYEETTPGKDNIASFELIPWILCQCSNIAQAKKLLANIHIVSTPFSKELPTSQLHWLIADRESAITVESVADGLHIFDNPVGILTNNPPFECQMHQLSRYMSLSPRNPENQFSKQLPLNAYSRGMGAMGLPGDLSSESRFVRAAFVKMNSLCDGSEEESLSQFFHILASVEQQKGCCEVAESAFEYTIYTSCYNASRGVFYYTTYSNRQITAVDMHRENLDGDSLIRFPLITKQQIQFQN